jgi:hypothetical protein
MVTSQQSHTLVTIATVCFSIAVTSTDTGTVTGSNITFTVVAATAHQQQLHKERH